MERETILMVLKKHPVAFYKPPRWFPDEMPVSALVPTYLVPCLCLPFPIFLLMSAALDAGHSSISPHPRGKSFRRNGQIMRGKSAAENNYASSEVCEKAS